MSTENAIDGHIVTLEDIRDNLETRTLNSIRNILPDAAILEACQAVGHVFRRRLVTPIVTALHMVLAALWPEDSFAASWQVLWDAMVSRLPCAAGRGPHASSVTKARSRLPLELWHKLFEGISRKAQALSAGFDRWRGHRVVLLDGTCVSMPDKPSLFDEFGTCNSKGRDGKYPLARLVTAALANTMTVLGYRLGRYRDGETTLAMPLLDMLEKGDLIVGDRHFAGANLYCHYLSRGLQFLTRVHQKLKVSRLQRIACHSRGDFVTRLKVNEIYRRQDPTLPAWVTVRLIHVVLRTRGKRQETWLVTSLLDAKQYPAREIAELYARRWRIETLFREVKVNLGADVLRSTTREGVPKEVAARLIAVNIVRMIMLEAAAKYGVDPLRISFIHATRAILVFAHALGSEPMWKLPDIYKAMLIEIAGHLVPERPARNEPRAIRRERKHYPTLRTTRRAWRLTNVA